MMKQLLVGLGNPGSSYARNRHNVGFMAVDAIHAYWNGGPWRRKFQSEIAEADVGGVRVMFLKPQTFMNESGRAVVEASRFYKFELNDIIVVHDEIDLPPGKFRMKTGGGTGGHNGLKSISAHMRDGYRRLRIGVGHPGRKELVPNYVLHDFARADDEWLMPMMESFAIEAPLLMAGNDAAFASKVHRRLTMSAGREKSGSAASANPIAARPPAEKATADKDGEEGHPAHTRAHYKLMERATSGPFSALAQLLRK